MTVFDGQTDDDEFEQGEIDSDDLAGDVQSQYEAPANTGPGEEEDDPLSDENEYTDEEDDAEAVKDLPFDADREAVLAELRAEGQTVPQGPQPEVEETSPHDARIDLQDEYEPGQAEALEQRFADEKAAQAAKEFVEWSRQFSAEQAAAREAARAPAPEQSQIPEPTAFEVMDDQTFDRILAARDEGLDYLPQTGEVDAAAVYGQFSQRFVADEDGDF